MDSIKKYHSVQNQIIDNFIKRSENINEKDYWRYGQELADKLDLIELEFIKKYTSDCLFLIDIGCGTGNHLSKLDVKHKTAVEVVPKYIEYLKKTQPKVTVIESSLLDLELESKYDAILLIGLIQYIISDDKCRNALSKLKNHLTPNGVVIIKSPVALGHSKVIEKISDGAPYISKYRSFQDHINLFNNFYIEKFESLFDSTNLSLKELSIVSGDNNTQQVMFVLK